MCAQTIELERQKLNSRFNMDQNHGQPTFIEQLLVYFFRLNHSSDGGGETTCTFRNLAIFYRSKRITKN